MADDETTPVVDTSPTAPQAPVEVTGTDETYPKPDGEEQAPNGVAAADDQTNISTPATADQPINGLPVSDDPSNENAVEQTTGDSTESPVVEEINVADDDTLIDRIDGWVKENYEALVTDGVKTWDDIEKNAKELDDRAVAAFARKRSAESGATVDVSTATTSKKTTR